MLGPRAFYAIVTFPDPTIGIEASVPYLFRADRIPTAMSGGWRMLRQTAGAADAGLASVVMNRTVWMLRSCSQDCLDARRKGANAAFAVDWQPLATENSQILRPPGPTIDLGEAVRARPAAGVTATADAIYVFGGRDTPTTRDPHPAQERQPRDARSRCRRWRASASARPLCVHGDDGLPRRRKPVGRLADGPGRRAGQDRGAGRPARRDRDRQRAEVGAAPGPNLQAGVRILTAAFARGQLWIIRSDGWIETMDVGAVAPGQSRLAWEPASVSINGAAPVTSGRSSRSRSTTATRST